MHDDANKKPKGESLKNKTINGVVWSAVERFLVYGVQMIVQLVIARILSPTDFGLIGMLTIFIAVSQSFIDSGFSQALVRKQNRTETDNSTVFYFNIVMSCVIYAILYFSAPAVADFYKEPQLVSLMRVLCLVLIINSFAVVQRAIYTASINFKTQAKATFTAVLLSGIVGVVMAVRGYGVWSLVFQQLSNALLNTLLLWAAYSSWRPRWIFSWVSFREMYSFGWKLLASGLLNTLYSNIYLLLIGKVYTKESLGHYTQAHTFAQLPSANATSIIQRVTYPVLCSIQDDDERLSRNYRQLLKLSAYLIFPIMCGLAAISRPLVFVLIGDKWLFASQLLVPMCFSMLWYPIHAINLNLLQVKGRSDLFLRLEIIKKFVGATTLVIGIRFGVYVLCWIGILSSLFCLFINTYYTGKLINVGFLKQMGDLLPTLGISLLMFLLVRLCIGFISSDWLQVVTGVLIGMTFYAGMTHVLKFSEYAYLKSIVANRFSK
ncbi:MAG: lipopolysaccharide biosynthesis protein [Paludibacteraceae bacterium]|nr:lipopolysaccharide biosynthesis protein [Paludibacteraceae bacterium]